MALRKVLQPLLPVYLQRPSRARDLAAWDAMACVGRQHLSDMDDPMTVLPERPLDHPGVLIPRPDEELEHENLLTALSEEAKEVIAIILEAPGEVLEMISSPMRGTITKPRLARYLRLKLGWPPEKVQGAFQELEHYANDLGAL